MEQMNNLRRPDRRVDAVLDTDTFNEIDDQFAIAYLLRSRERVELKAIYAAPFYDENRRFYNYNSNSPREGMERSYEEILRLLELAGREDLKASAFQGADRFLPDENSPVDSPAVRDLIRRAMGYTPEEPLYVIGIAAPTNIASALLLCPEIADRIVVVWLGGNDQRWPTCREFNLSQDLHASRALFASQAPLVQVPCMGVASSFAVTPGELKRFVLGKNPLCDHLAEAVLAAMGDPEAVGCWSRVLWDVTPCGWLAGDFALDRIERRPGISDEETYTFDADSRPMGYVYHIHRDALMQDLFAKLTRE